MDWTESLRNMDDVQPIFEPCPAPCPALASTSAAPASACCRRSTSETARRTPAIPHSGHGRPTPPGRRTF